MDKDERAVLLRTIAREKDARKQAEQFAEARTRELYAANEKLKALAGNLQERVDARTAELTAAKDDAERANVAKTTFLATMSHEIRTPLNVILGMADLVLEGELSQEQRSLMKRVSANSETLLAIINDILDVSRIEAGELRISRERFSPGDVAEDVAEALCLQALGNEIQIVCDVDVGAPSAVLGDGPRLRQILLNLGSNAVKFTKNGEVVITMRALEKQDDRWWFEFRVMDTGPGIPKDKIDSIFEPFVRLSHEGAHRSVPGAGLGLNISQALVRAMGGSIEVRSEEDVGSTFVAKIAFDRDEDSVEERERFTRPVAVVLVHCHAPTRSVLRSNLEHVGAHVVEASSLEQAKADAVLFSEPLWVVDADLPGIDEHANYLRHRKLILLSDVSLKIGEVRAAMGAPAVVPAPYRFQVLFDAIESIDDVGTRRSLSLHPTSRRSVQADRGRVLVVEDNEDNQKYFKIALTAMGVHVHCVTDGQAALTCLQDEAFDLILSDIQMPVMDGFQFIRELRARECQSPNTRSNVVALTADATAGVRVQCKNAGFDEYVTKPVSRQALAQLVEKYVTSDDAPLADVDPLRDSDVSEDRTTPDVDLLRDGNASEDRTTPDVDLLRDGDVSEDRTTIEVDADMIDLVPEFFRNRWKNLRKMRTLCEERKFDDLRAIAHGEKGVGGTYGFFEITTLAQKLESACDQRDETKVNVCLQSLATYLHRVRAVGTNGQSIPSIEFK